MSTNSNIAFKIQFAVETFLSNISDKNDLQITETLLYGDRSLDDKSKTLILNATIHSPQLQSLLSAAQVKEGEGGGGELPSRPKKRK